MERISGDLLLQRRTGSETANLLGAKLHGVDGGFAAHPKILFLNVCAPVC